MNWKETDWKWNYYQGLIQKEKVHINCKKGAQISFLNNNIATQWWPNIIRKESKHLFIIYLLLCSHYVADLVKILELCLMVVSVLLKIKFGHGQISVPKISIPMSETAYIKVLTKVRNELRRPKTI